MGHPPLGKTGSRLTELSQRWAKQGTTYLDGASQQALNVPVKKTLHALAVDIGCGTGQVSRSLAPHFEKIIGVDISEAQLDEARKETNLSNVKYIKCHAEDLPADDGSVDLITAAHAAHWFDKERFLKEVNRVLKPGGCVALFGFTTGIEFSFPGVNPGRLTDIYEEEFEHMLPYRSKLLFVNDSMLQELFEAIDYPEKERIENLRVKRPISVSGAVGLIESFSVYQCFLRAEPVAAKATLKRMHQRVHMEELDDDGHVDFWPLIHQWRGITVVVAQITKNRKKNKRK
ncbi:CRG1 methyltransferase, partial [Polypterus senegalus]